jgi:hypothetical protein
MLEPSAARARPLPVEVVAVVPRNKASIRLSAFSFARKKRDIGLRVFQRVEG